MNKDENIGDIYHEETKYHRDYRMTRTWTPPEMAEPYKIYSNAKKIHLPKSDLSSGISIWDVILQRRSIRQYSSESISIDELSIILWATQGITLTLGRHGLRAAPSAGALYPIETYIQINHVEQLEAGIYHYGILNHELEMIRKGDFGAEMAHSALGQSMMRNSAFNLIWTGIIARSKWKYLERAYRYIYMDAGHICQNAYLASEALGMGCCGIGAFFDDEVGEIIGVDGKEEIVVYMCSIGKKQ
jgi:SagB-type dehydrogenase family enzyme